MTNEQLIKNLSVPAGKIDVILDTDTYNEIDDQFAIAYMLKSQDKLNIKAIYAAPFFIPAKCRDIPDGMEKSYNEILKILDLAGEKIDVFKGSLSYLPDEKTPVISEAAEDLVKKASAYSPEKPLYIVAIGAITNIASALLIKPEIAENIVVVWLGGNAIHYHDTKEFNMMQDIAAARVIINSGVPFVQLPCMGVVSQFTISVPELEYWLLGKNPLADYLAKNTIKEVKSYADGKVWSRVIWDVTAVAWLLNENDRFMLSRVIPSEMPSYDYRYSRNPNGQLMRYVYNIKRDELMDDLVKKLLK